VLLALSFGLELTPWAQAWLVAPWTDAVARVAAVQVLYIVRVISLLYPGPWNKDVFEWAHLYVWQALIMLDVLVVWVIGVRLAGVHRAGGGNALAA